MMFDFGFILTLGLAGVVFYRFAKGAKCNFQFSLSKAIAVAIAQILILAFVFLSSYFILRIILSLVFSQEKMINTLSYLIGFGSAVYIMKKMDHFLKLVLTK
jgi:hypothetical protein